MKNIILIFWLCFRTIVSAIINLFITCLAAISGHLIDDFFGTTHAKFPVAKLKAICRVLSFEVDIKDYTKDSAQKAIIAASILPLPEPDTRKWWQRIF